MRVMTFGLVVALMGVGAGLASADQPLPWIPLGVENPQGRVVFVVAREPHCRWRLRVPERVLADPKQLLVDHHGVPLQWQWRKPKTLIGTSTPGQAPVALRVEIRPQPWGLQLRMKVTNTSAQKLENVVAHVCLSHDYANGPIRFRDPQAKRSFVVTSQGLRSLAQLGVGLRSHFRVQGQQPIGFFSSPERPEYVFWGRGLRPQVVQEPWICGTDRSGRWSVSVFWDQAAEVFQNGDQPNRCIHSDPNFGDLEPGASAVRVGGVMLIRGDAHAALRAYRWWQKHQGNATSQPDGP